MTKFMTVPVAETSSEIEIPSTYQSGFNLEARLSGVVTIDGAGQDMTATIAGTKVMFFDAELGEWVPEFSHSGTYLAVRTESGNPHAAAMLIARWRGDHDTPFVGSLN